MKKTLLLVGLFALISEQYSTAQIKIEAPIAASDNASMNSSMKQEQLYRVLDQRAARNVQTYDNRYEGVKGTPFVFDDWSEGTLVLKDSSRVTQQLAFKFDLMQNELWIRLPNGQQRILYNNEILAFDLYRTTGKKYIFKKVKLPEKVDNNHFSQILYEGQNFTLVKDSKKIFRKSNLEDKGVVTVGNPYDWFEEHNEYFVKKSGRSLEKIKMKRGDFIEMMPKSLEKQIESFCKKNDLSGKLSDDDAVKLIQYIDNIK